MLQVIRAKSLLNVFFTKRGVNDSQDFRTVSLRNTHILKKFCQKKPLFMHQTHSDKVIIVDRKSQNISADAMISIDKKVALCVRVADCLPILICDFKTQAKAAIHSGRAGSFKNILGKTVAQMQREFGCNTRDLGVVIGFGIKDCCYEVGLDCFDAKYAQAYIQRENRLFLSLQKIVDNQAKILKFKQIEWLDECTCCGSSFFSHRKKDDKRFVGVVH